MTSIPDRASMKGMRAIIAVNMGDVPSMRAAYIDTNSEASLCTEFLRSISIADSSSLRFLFLSAFSVM